MKRDWELIKKIMTEIEQDNLGVFFDNSSLDEQIRILKHIELLEDCDYVADFELSKDINGDFTEPTLHHGRLTMQGYEFYEVIRDKKMWEKIVSMANKSKVFLTIEFIKSAIPVLYASLFK